MANKNEEAKILQFNQMKGVQSGKVEYKNGEMLLQGQKAQPLPGQYLLLEVEANGNIVNCQKAKFYDLRSTTIIQQ